MDIEKLADSLFKQMEARIAASLAPVLAKLEALEAKEIPKADDIVREILAGDRLETLVDLHVTEAVAALPPPKDGEDAPPVTEDQVAKAVAGYLQANPVKNGEDGIGIAAFMRNEKGELIATNTRGEIFNLGKIKGEDGKDGLGFDDLTVSFDGDAIVHEYKRGDQCKSVRFPLNVMRHIGFWREGMAAKSGNTVTNSGSLWLALRDTDETPSYNAKDWILAARAGRDGQDKTDAKPSQPVKLNG